MGGDTYAEAALADIEATLRNDVARVDFRELLEPRLRRILLLGVALAFLQHWAGST